MRYKVTINTDNYKCGECSKANWEPGTRNDYMIAINGLTRKLNSIKEVKWQINIFIGFYYPSSEWIEGEGYSARYIKFLEKNLVKYYDRLCGVYRCQYLSGYGFMQGYFDVDEVIKDLKANGITKIPFKWLYDIRQYDRAMDGCYMEIRRVS